MTKEQTLRVIQESIQKALKPFEFAKNTKETQEKVLDIVKTHLQSICIDYADHILLEVGTDPANADQIAFTPKNIYTALLLDGVVPPSYVTVAEVRQYLGSNNCLYYYDDNNDVCKKAIPKIVSSIDKYCQERLNHEKS